MVDALRKHVRLLEQYAHKLFHDRELDYSGEVAGKLRLLVVRFRSNQPLLLRLLEETGADIKLVLDGPPIQNLPIGQRPGDVISLEDFLELSAGGVRVPSGEFVEMTKLQLIRAWAEQTGAPHEDWSMDPALRQMLNPNILIAGLPIFTMELQTTTAAVLRVARRFLELVDGGQVSLDEAAS